MDRVVAVLSCFVIICALGLLLAAALQGWELVSEHEDCHAAGRVVSCR